MILELQSYTNSLTVVCHWEMSEDDPTRSTPESVVSILQDGYCSKSFMRWLCEGAPQVIKEVMREVIKMGKKVLILGLGDKCSRERELRG
jgi:hypothetical protein